MISYLEKVIKDGENEDFDHSDQGNKRGRKRKRQRKGDCNTQPKIRKSTLLEKVTLTPLHIANINVFMQSLYFKSKSKVLVLMVFHFSSRENILIIDIKL